MSVSKTAFQQAYEQNPIIMNGGVVGSGISIPLGTMLGTATAVGSAITSLLSGEGFQLGYEGPRFMPAPGMTLLQSMPAMYPTIDQGVAVSAMIPQPRQVGIIMSLPSTNGRPMSVTRAITTMLRDYLSEHERLGGTYTVLTPSSAMDNCLLISVQDVTDRSTQVQWMWRLDFQQPITSTKTGIASSLGSIAKGVTNGIKSLTNKVKNPLSSLGV